MTYKQLQKALNENEKKFAEMESIIQKKIDIEMSSKLPDKNAVLRMKEQIVTIRARMLRQHERIKKEYAMQNSAADIGDVVEAEIKTERGKVREIVRRMRVERIEVAAFKEPQLTYYGTYLKRDLTPQARQMIVPIFQNDIVRVIKSLKKPFNNNNN